LEGILLPLDEIILMNEFELWMIACILWMKMRRRSYGNGGGDQPSKVNQPITGKMISYHGIVEIKKKKST